jgi:hypothetical protein
MVEFDAVTSIDCVDAVEDSHVSVPVGYWSALVAMIRTALAVLARVLSGDGPIL